jgi:hypothetical protein
VRKPNIIAQTPKTKTAATKSHPTIPSELIIIGNVSAGNVDELFIALESPQSSLLYTFGGNGLGILTELPNSRDERNWGREDF